MAFISDILLIAGAIAAAFYCMVLSRRLAKFNDLENGVGGAVAVLAIQVDDMTKTLEMAQNAAGDSTTSLKTLTAQAEDVAGRLELLLASMHDLPEQSPQPANKANADEEAMDASFFRHRSRILEAAE